MSLWIVVGGQFGSEGKGKVAAQIIKRENISISVRCGGPNSGHSFTLDNGQRVLLRQLSVGVVCNNTRLLIPAGGVVNLQILYEELRKYGLDEKRVGIDKNALILEDDDIKKEAELELNKTLSSTGSGTGFAVARRILRKEATLAHQVNERWFTKLLTNTADECIDAINRNEGVLIEGTQGAGLSLYHSPFYPKATSRDTLPAGALSEVGLSPMLVSEIVCVFRTYPIRVAGLQAGPLSNEINWDMVQKESGYPYEITEQTSVTRKVRRVGLFDWKLAESVIKQVRPTRVALMGIDYINYADKGKIIPVFSKKSKEFIEKLDNISHVQYIGTGPKLNEFIER